MGPEMSRRDEGEPQPLTPEAVIALFRSRFLAPDDATILADKAHHEREFLPNDDRSAEENWN